MNETNYQIRMNDTPVMWDSMFSQKVINDFIAIQRDNPEERVDVVQVSTLSIISSYEYGQFERHFKASDERRITT